MRTERLKEACQRYGTPLYVYDIDQACKAAEECRSLLGPDIGLCFAMKANPFLTGSLAEAADRIEVCSMGEYYICRELSVPPEKLLISGVLKEEADLQEILHTYGGRCAYTAESQQQFQFLREWSRDNQEEVLVYLRLTSGNQFGMDPETASDLIRKAKISQFLSIAGIHYFSGTQKSGEKIRQELRMLDQQLLCLEEETRTRIEELEYGPGLAAAYFEGQDDTRTEDLKAAAESVRAMRWKGKVTFEMGRGLTAQCGYYLTTVKDVKENRGKRYCIVDGGIHQIHYDGQIRGMYCPSFRLLGETAAGQEELWTVCGSLCTSNDVLIQKARVRDLKPGDVFVFERTGAYAAMEGMALFLSHELPGAVLYSERDGWKQARKRQPVYPWNMEKIQSGKENTNGKTTGDFK